MPNDFIIKGGNSLSGTIDVRGSKNAALSILVATLLTREKCKISNLPLVSDVYQILDILSRMGADIKWLGKRTIEIMNKNIDPRGIDTEAVQKMRASILFLGPLLARFGGVDRIYYPGGCSIGARPIDTHLRAFEDLGARVVLNKKFFSIELPRAGVRREVSLNEFSVTATENVLTFLSSIPSKSQIKIAASEPHIQDLAKFLSKMGAKINGVGTHTIEVSGKVSPRGASHEITPDYIEAGTFIIAILAVGGRVRVRNVPISHLDFVIKKLISSGADIRLFPRSSSVEVVASSSGLGVGGRRMIMDAVQSLPYPGIPTDLQSVFSVLATQTSGATRIHEPLYEKRLGSVLELNKMGAKTKVLDPHRAIVWGPKKLRGARVNGNDLRAGAALVIAGLSARGTTIVRNAEHVDRGYEDLAGRLCKLGADINRI